MVALGRRYVPYVNAAYQRSGTLWEGRYKSSLIQSESYLLACMRYIELNPVRAGICLDPAHYHWSSYRANALGETKPRGPPRKPAPEPCQQENPKQLGLAGLDG